VTDPPAEAAPNDRRQVEADESWGDRPGIVASLLRYRLIVVAVTLLGAMAGYGIAQLLPVRYQAEAVLIPSDPGGPSIVGGGGTSLPSSDREVYLAKQVDIMTSSIVLGRAVQILGTKQSVRDIKSELNVQSSKDMASISIGATAADSGSAAALANAVGTAYEQVTAERADQQAQRAIASLEKLRNRLQAELDASPRPPDGRLTSRQQQLAAQITDLEQREQDITTQVEVYASGVELFERAEPPDSPTQPKPKLTVMLGALLGLLGAAAWAWWAAARHQRAEGRGDPAPILGAPLLGEVPGPPLLGEVPGLSARRLSAGKPVTSPPVLTPPVADAYHFVVASLKHELAELGGTSIAVTSVGPGDSKTSIALNIAKAAYQENRKILLIDADVRTLRLTELFGFTQFPHDRNRQDLPVPVGEPTGTNEYARRLVSTGSGMVLPAASNGSDPGHLPGSYPTVDVRQALLSIGEKFDLVLIDTPPLLASSNALGVAGQADGVVLVVPHRVSLSYLRDVRERLAFVKTPLIGYVYVRSRGFGIGPLRGRGTRRRDSGAAVQGAVLGREK
jgi:Mrp family chromosome partitioning ATPase/capsular polysaccharide biosynthesis protein